MRLRALELFCGIGGFAAAMAGSGVQVAAAFDQSRVALNVYALNFPAHGVRHADLERIDADRLAAVAADLWWLSPPCQPYTVRGRRRDLDDPRARSLVRLLEILADLPPSRLPRYLAVENVPGFAASQAREVLTDRLRGRGYQVAETLLCPTELGVPSRRPRYYLVASRAGLVPRQPPYRRQQPLLSFLEPYEAGTSPAELLLPAETVARFGSGLRILDVADPSVYTTCFTAGYGRSLMHAGSFLRCSGGVRRFAPVEIARLLGFPPGFRFPDELPLRKCWHLLGNSLSVTAVREVLGVLPELELPRC